MKKTVQPVTIKKDEKNPEPMELIAKSIIEISAAFKKMNSCSLKPRTVFLLIKDMTGISMSDIEKVLNAAASLEKTFVKQK
jgi:hypothetical protein